MRGRAAANERLCSKPFRLERRGIDERRLAGHHVGEKPGGDGAERQAEMVMAEVEP